VVSVATPELKFWDFVLSKLARPFLESIPLKKNIS
jgi:hypothetical protein